MSEELCGRTPGDVLCRAHGADQEGAGRTRRRLLLASTLLAAVVAGSTQTRPAAAVQTATAAGRQTTVYSRYTVENFRTYAPFGKTIDAEKPDYALLDAAVYFVTNEARVKQGKRAVPYHPRLEKTAFDYAREMVAKDFFSHEHPSDPAQRKPSDRGKLAGIKNASLAENIAENFAIQYEAGKSVYVMDPAKGIFSYTSPDGPAIPMHTYLSLAQALVDQWMKSPGHRANILSDNNRSFGCGVYFFRDKKFNNMLKVKAVQVFQWFEDVKE